MRDEFHFFLNSTLPSLNLAARFTNKKVLLIVVLNARLGDSHAIMETQKKLGLELGALPNQDLSFCQYSENLTLALVHCYRPGRQLGAKEGVGRARKIGSDLALQLFQEGILEEGWIYASDADVIFAESYFQLKLPSPEDYSLTNLPFAHFVDDEMPKNQQKAVEVYDSFLRYYVAGLEWANFNYAFQNVGSTQVLSMLAYAKVRGYPNLMAGEDFYLAQKLAKVGKVASPNEDPLLFLSGRVSNRVPFGTGVSVSKILNDLNNSEEYTVYHPKTFVVLKLLLEKLQESVFYKDVRQLQSQLELSEDYVSALGGFLESEKILAQLEKIWGMSPQAPALQKHINNFFDGFVILKLVHYLRDHSFGLLELRSAWTELEKLGSQRKSSDIPRLAFQKDVEVKT